MCALAQVRDQILLDDVCVGLGKDILLPRRSHFPGSDDHIEELVLVQVPRGIHANNTFFLGYWTSHLGFVKIKLNA